MTAEPRARRRPAIGSRRVGAALTASIGEVGQRVAGGEADDLDGRAWPRACEASRAGRRGPRHTALPACGVGAPDRVVGGRHAVTLDPEDERSPGHRSALQLRHLEDPRGRYPGVIDLDPRLIGRPRAGRPRDRRCDCPHPDRRQGGRGKAGTRHRATPPGGALTMSWRVAIGRVAGMADRDPGDRRRRERRRP